MSTLDRFHEKAFSTLREELVHMAEVNVAAGTTVHEGVPPLEQIELDKWGVHMAEQGAEEVHVAEFPDNWATAMLDKGDGPIPISEIKNHAVKPAVWCYVTYLEYGRWFYGLGIHPLEMTLICFHRPVEREAHPE